MITATTRAVTKADLAFIRKNYQAVANVFTNSAPNATGVYDPKCVPVQLADNVFQGVAIPVEPIGCTVKK